jgi:YegS/Rv2252/BmrU family lipid kinase
LIALVANPDSGGGEADEVAEAMRSLGAQVVSYRPDDVETALAAGPDRLIVAGGDGSLAPAAAAAASAGIPLGVVPTGTANDFARAMGIPGEIAEAVRLAVEGEDIRDIDLGWMDDRPFLNVASLGLAPAAAKRASGLKGALGPLAYTVGAIGAGAKADPVRCRVEGDGETLFEGQVWQVTVGCSGAFGGGSSVDADPADGRLDLVAVEAGSRLRLVRHAYGLRVGDISGQPGVRDTRCASARIALEGKEPFNVDGEVVESGSCSFGVEPAAVRVVVG